MHAAQARVPSLQLLPRPHSVQYGSELAHLSLLKFTTSRLIGKGGSGGEGRDFTFESIDVKMEGHRWCMCTLCMRITDRYW